MLVVDDEIFFRDLVRASLERAHFAVVEAGDGVEGLALLRQVRPDVIVCDEVMPRMTGIQMLRAVRATSETQNIPFLLVTGFASGVWDGMKRSNEQFGILVKPFTPAELLSALGEITGVPTDTSLD